MPYHFFPMIARMRYISRWGLMRQIVLQGQQRGELRGDVTVNEMVRVYALCERALIYDWCLSGGDYSLLQYGRIMMPMFLGGFRTSQKNFVQNI